MSNMNRMANAGNKFQGNDVKVLCVCSAGLLRSPTLARLLVRDFKNVNSRAVGVNNEFALIALDDVLLTWADVVLTMSGDHFNAVEDMLSEMGIDREVHCLNVPDDFCFGAPELETILKEKMNELLNTLQDLVQRGEESSLVDLERF